MLRAIDLRLLLGSGASSAVVSVALLRRGAGAVAVPLGLGIAVAIDEVAIDALPAVNDVPGTYLAVTIAAAVVLMAVVATCRRRLAGPGVLGWVLPLMAAGAAYAAVPETSYALLVGGVLAGIGVVGLLQGVDPSAGLCAAMAAAPVLAVAFGAAGVPQALAGGLLACAPGLLLGSITRPPSVPIAAVIVAVAGVAGAAAARGLAVHRTWDGVLVVVAIEVVALAVSVAIDRRTRQVG